MAGNYPLMNSPARVRYRRSLRGGDRLNPGWFHPRRYHLTAFRKRLEELLEDVEPKKDGVVLDYGCGFGPYRPLFEQRSFRYLGADLTSSSNAELSLNEDGRIPMPDQSVDLVFSSQVLEHVADPGRYLLEAYRVLVPGGLLILSAPGTWRYHPDPADYWRWTADGLVRQIELAGFNVLRSCTVGNLSNAAVQLWQDATARFVPRGLRSFYVFALQGLMAGLDYLGNRRRQSESKDGHLFTVLAVRSPRPANT